MIQLLVRGDKNTILLLGSASGKTFVQKLYDGFVKDFGTAELEFCECGKVYPVDQLVIHEDGCWNCVQCIKDMNDEANRN